MSWAKGEIGFCSPFLEYIGSIIGAPPVGDQEIASLLLALALGSLTGYDYCFDIVVEKYYDYKDLAESSPLSIPRQYRDYVFFTEAVEAAIEFEESLADSRRVLFAEPVLVAALKAVCIGREAASIRVNSSLSTRTFLVKSGRKKGRVAAPYPLYLLALKTISLLFPQRVFDYGLEVEGAVIAPDPAEVRDYLFRARPSLEDLGKMAEKYIMAQCRRVQGVSLEKACSEKGVIVTAYRVKGLEWETWYVC